jgi:hypothetical protein
MRVIEYYTHDRIFKTLQSEEKLCFNDVWFVRGNKE